MPPPLWEWNLVNFGLMVATVVGLFTVRFTIGAVKFCLQRGVEPEPLGPPPDPEKAKPKDLEDRAAAERRWELAYEEAKRTELRWAWHRTVRLPFIFAVAWLIMFLFSVVVAAYFISYRFYMIQTVLGFLSFNTLFSYFLWVKIIAPRLIIPVRVYTADPPAGGMYVYRGRVRRWSEKPAPYFVTVQSRGFAGMKSNWQEVALYERKVGQHPVGHENYAKLYSLPYFDPSQFRGQGSDIAYTKFQVWEEEALHRFARAGERTRQAIRSGVLITMFVCLVALAILGPTFVTESPAEMEARLKIEQRYGIER